MGTHLFESPCTSETKIQKCLFLVSLCFNPSTIFWKTVSKNNCRKRQSCVCLNCEMKFNEKNFHQTKIVKDKFEKQPKQLNVIFWVCRWCSRPKRAVSRANNLMIFDNLLQKQNSCDSYYVGGRHSNCDGICHTTTFKLPRQTIRENTNCFCLFPTFQNAKKYWPYFQRPRQLRYDQTSIQTIVDTRMVKNIQHCTNWINFTKNSGKYRSGFVYSFVVDQKNGYRTSCKF